MITDTANNKSKPMPKGVLEIEVKYRNDTLILIVISKFRNFLEFDVANGRQNLLISGLGLWAF